MKAGRELDSRVAEDVIGLRDLRMVVSMGKERLIDSTGDEVPCYSTDIGAAFEVVDIIRAKRKDLIFVLQLETNEWRARLDTADFTVESRWSSTAPEAICIAATLLSDVFLDN